MNLKQNQKGFTIVELLIVIVVIAILAAISIVAYTGVQSRSRASAAKSLASNIAKKAEIYNIDPDTTGYPTTLAALTGAAATTTYAIPSSDVAFVATNNITASTSNLEKAINFQRCGHASSTTAPTTIAGITTTTGNRVGFWNGTAIEYINVGVTAHTGTAHATTNPAIGCVNTAT